MAKTTKYNSISIPNDQLLNESYYDRCMNNCDSSYNQAEKGLNRCNSKIEELDGKIAAETDEKKKKSLEKEKTQYEKAKSQYTAEMNANKTSKADYEAAKAKFCAADTDMGDVDADNDGFPDDPNKTKSDKDDGTPLSDNVTGGDEQQNATKKEDDNKDPDANVPGPYRAYLIEKDVKQKMFAAINAVGTPQPSDSPSNTSADILDFRIPVWGVSDFINERAQWQKQITSATGEPGWFYFKVFFDFRNSEGLLADILKDTNQYGNTAFKYLLYSYQYYNQEKMLDRLKALVKFVCLLSYINCQAPWFFKSVSGLDKANNRIYTKDFGAEKTIEIGCSEDAIDMRLNLLMDLYKYAAYDDINCKEILPENLRKFNMSVLVFNTPVKYYQTAIKSQSGQQFNYKNFAPAPDMVVNTTKEAETVDETQNAQGTSVTVAEPEPPKSKAERKAEKEAAKRAKKERKAEEKAAKKTAKKEAKDKKDKRKKDLSDAKKPLDDAQKAYDDVQKAYNAAVKAGKSEEELNTLINALRRAKKTLSSAKQKYDEDVQRINNEFNATKDDGTNDLTEEERAEVSSGESNGPLVSTTSLLNYSNTLSYKMFTFHNCEFMDLGTMMGGSLSNERPNSLGKSSIKIKYDRVYTHTMNEWNNMMFGSDGFQYIDKDETLQIDVNDNFNNGVKNAMNTKSSDATNYNAERLNELSNALSSNYYDNSSSNYKYIVDLSESLISDALIGTEAAMGNLYNYYGSISETNNYFKNKLSFLHDGSVSGNIYEYNLTRSGSFNDRKNTKYLNTKLGNIKNGSIQGNIYEYDVIRSGKEGKRQNTEYLNKRNNTLRKGSIDGNIYDYDMVGYGQGNKRNITKFFKLKLENLHKGTIDGNIYDYDLTRTGSFTKRKNTEYLDKKLQEIKGNGIQYKLNDNEDVIAVGQIEDDWITKYGTLNQFNENEESKSLISDGTIKVAANHNEFKESNYNGNSKLSDSDIRSGSISDPFMIKSQNPLYSQGVKNEYGLNTNKQSLMENGETNMFDSMVGGLKNFSLSNLFKSMF